MISLTLAAHHSHADTRPVNRGPTHTASSSPDVWATSVEAPDILKQTNHLAEPWPNSSGLKPQDTVVVMSSKQKKWSSVLISLLQTHTQWRCHVGVWIYVLEFGEEVQGEDINLGESPVLFYCSFFHSAYHLWHFLDNLFIMYNVFCLSFPIQCGLRKGFLFYSLTYPLHAQQWLTYRNRHSNICWINEPT